jgi:uncharacterized membrane protein YjjB (DUF3815 family)
MSLVMVLCIVVGVFGGFSAGMGFAPIFKQPKNLIIQLILGTIALVAIIWLINILKSSL